jgi:GNAT superfamily N-acetyltransferase
MGSGFDIRDVRLEASPENILIAIWKGQQIGAVIINPYCVGCLPENAWTIFSSGVLSEFRRKGVATLLYDTVEKYLADMGYELWPTLTLSNDAYEFWKNRDSGKMALAIKNSLRCLEMPETMRLTKQALTPQSARASESSYRSRPNRKIGQQFNGPSVRSGM